MDIRLATPADAAAIAALILPVIRAGETYALDRDLSEAAALAYWLAPDKQTFVAAEQGALLGTYYLRPNQSGGGRHVANCGFITAEAARGRGIAAEMGQHALRTAHGQGYRAMQFNCVVSTNHAAIRLWHRLGFATVGHLPGAFAHPDLGDVDALVMYRVL